MKPKSILIIIITIVCQCNKVKVTNQFNSPYKPGNYAIYLYENRLEDKKSVTVKEVVEKKEKNRLVIEVNFSGDIRRRFWMVIEDSLENRKLNKIEALYIMNKDGKIEKKTPNTLLTQWKELLIFPEKKSNQIKKKRESCIVGSLKMNCVVTISELFYKGKRLISKDYSAEGFLWEKVGSLIIDAETGEEVYKAWIVEFGNTNDYYPEEQIPLYPEK